MADCILLVISYKGKYIELYTKLLGVINDEISQKPECSG